MYHTFFTEEMQPLFMTVRYAGLTACIAVGAAALVGDYVHRQLIRRYIVGAVRTALGDPDLLVQWPAQDVGRLRDLAGNYDQPRPPGVVLSWVHTTTLYTSTGNDLLVDRNGRGYGTRGRATALLVHWPGCGGWFVLRFSDGSTKVRTTTKAPEIWDLLIVGNLGIITSAPFE